VLVLTGAGDESFCAGADLKALDTLAPRMADPGGPLGFTRRAASKPTIAAVGGWCLAGGLELALWCDLRIASDTATFGLPERRWGVPLVDGGTQRLPRVVGLGRALDLVLTGRLIGAAEAHAIGLVTEIVARGRHLERALEVAEGLARFPQRTLLADRRATHAALGLELAEGLELEAGGAADTLADAAAGAARFAAGEGRGGAGAGV
jgi:enoyl-CoA hydratase/carnithine racemase